MNRPRNNNRNFVRMRIMSRQPRLPAHEHQMVPNRDEANLFKCSGCQELGFGQRYQCAKMSNCDFVLHEQCFTAYSYHPSQQITLPLLDFQYTFQFFLSPPVRRRNRRLCDACQREVRGYWYHGQCSEHNLYLHPCCMNFQNTMYDPNSRMTLTLYDNMPANIRCAQCQWWWYNRPLGGWSYLSAGGNYGYHAYCLWKLVLDNSQRVNFNNNNNDPPRGINLIRGRAPANPRRSRNSSM